jgi:hypothetical protein
MNINFHAILLHVLDDQQWGSHNSDWEKLCIACRHPAKFMTLYPVSSCISVLHTATSGGFSANLASKIADDATTDGR